MSKYIEVIKITFKSQIAYRFDVVLEVLLSFIRIILAFIMWSVLFQNKTEIAGFSLGMMITYYIIMSFFLRLDQSDIIVNKVSSEIREGKFSKYLVKPVKPLWYFISLSLSKSIFIFIINVIATIIYAFVFANYFEVYVSLKLVLSSFIINFLGIFFMMLLNYLIGIFSFKFVDISAFNMIKNNVFQFLTGALIPLVVLPLWIINAMKIFPFYYIYYYPTLLFLNKEIDDIWFSFIVLCLWIIVMYIIVAFSYKILIRKYEGVGI